MKSFHDLPVYQHMQEISETLKENNSIVIQAEPGAGKTMLIPVIEKEICAEKGQIILVEPRRIAAKTAAHGIAEMHGFTLGRECGFAVRGESCRCLPDGIIAVTSGVMLQMLQKDPALEGVSAVILDEFHERSWEMDLILTLILDMRDSLREDLMLTVMSATVDGEKISRFIKAPLLKISGRGFPVDIHHMPMPSSLRELPMNTAKTVIGNIHRSSGDILVFLPGEKEIRECASLLENTLDSNFILHKLHGSLSLDEQRAAISPAPHGRRKIILSTNIAESSLTVSGVDMVIDTGWERRSQWDTGAGKSFLETGRISVDSAVQRAGRAGRLARGQCIRCYSAMEMEHFPKHICPEIYSTDLTPLLLAVGCWGTDTASLRWLDEPPASGVLSAKKVLENLGLFSAEGRPSPLGIKAASLPVSPRIAAMMLNSPVSMRKDAAAFAAVLEEKDNFAAFDTADLRERVRRMHSSRGSWHVQKNIEKQLLKLFPPDNTAAFGDSGVAAAMAFPEWIGRRRHRSSTVYQLAGGGAAVLKEDDCLRSEEFLAIVRLDGRSPNASIRLALPLQAESLERYFPDSITERTASYFEHDKLYSFSEKCFGEIVLNRKNIPLIQEDAVRVLIKEAVHRNITLPPEEDKRANSLVCRINFACRSGMSDLAEIDHDSLADLSPLFPSGIRSFADLQKADWFNIIHASMEYRIISELDKLCPEFFTSPAGVKFPVDYSASQPTLSIPLQQLYGVTEHPTVGKNHIPLRIELLSPARRPIQITCDLPGFWKGSWTAVRKEMKSRYPKHEWPEDPAAALPMRNSLKKRLC